MQLLQDSETESFVDAAVKIRNPAKQDISDPISSTLFFRQSHPGIKSRAPDGRGGKFLR